MLFVTMQMLTVTLSALRVPVDIKLLRHRKTKKEVCVCGGGELAFSFFLV